MCIINMLNMLRSSHVSSTQLDLPAKGLEVAPAEPRSVKKW